MEILEQADQRAFIWLNGWVGYIPWLDATVRVLASDYLVPLVMALALLGLWFAGASVESRWRNQQSVIASVLSIALSNAMVEALNQFLFRPRPFASLNVSLLFYRPTDSSFPANPAALGFAVATGVWLWNPKLGTILLLLAAVYGVSRVYAGVFYPLDILGGTALGIGSALFAAFLVCRFKALPVSIVRAMRVFHLA